MGLEVIRFINSNEINPDLICIICKGVLEDPVWAQLCEHAFCKVCINEWLVRKNTCPNDRQLLRQSNLKPIPRFMRNVLGKLEIKCDFVLLGCDEVIKLETLRQHISVCDFNPEKRIECESGCGLIIKKGDINDHNCVKELRKSVNVLVEENKKYDRVLTAVKYEMNSLRNENNRLNELSNNLANDIKHIKQLVGLKSEHMSDANVVSCISGAQTTSPSLTSMATSTSVKTSERYAHNSRLVPNPCVLITPLQMSSLRTETVLSTTDEPSSSTLLTSSSSGRLIGEEPAFKRRATAMRSIPTLRPIPIIRSYSPPSNYSSPTNSPRYVPNMPALSPQNESISLEEENGTTITIADYSSSYNYITLDAEQDFEDNDENETEENNQMQDEEYSFEVTNDDN